MNDEYEDDGLGGNPPAPLINKKPKTEAELLLEKKEEEDKDKRILLFMDREYVALRREVESIRRCQTTYFWSSITVSGAIIGLAVGMLGVKEVELFYVITAFLAPLLIITPMWCIYFDKASLLVRMSAYIRVLERMIIDFDNGKKIFCGFENYTKLFRQKVCNSYKQNKRSWMSRVITMIENAFFVKDSGISRVINFKMPNQTIYLVWSTYFLISLLCFVLVTYLGIKKDMCFFTFLAILIFLSSCTYTLYVVRELVNGNPRSQSYREYECLEIMENAKESHLLYSADKLKDEL